MIAALPRNDLFLTRPAQQSVPEIVEVWYVTGDYDFALRVVARDMESFETMTREVLYADNHVKNFKTLVSMRNVKTQGPLKAAELGRDP